MAKMPLTMRSGGDGPGNGIQPLIFLVIVGLVMGGTVLWLADWGESEVERVPIKRLEPETEIADITVIGNPWDPMLDSWGAIDDRVPTDQRSIPVPALHRAVELVGRRSWDTFIMNASTLNAEWVGFERMDIPRLFQSSAGLRGQPFEVVGTLVDIDTIDVFDEYGRMKLDGGSVKARRGLILPRESVHGSQVPVQFLMADHDPKFPVYVGDEVKLQGVFFKLQEFDYEGERVVGPWMIGKSAFPTYKLPEPNEIDLSFFGLMNESEQVKNLVGVLEDPQILHLLAEVHYHPDRDRGEPEEFTGKKVTSLILDPSKHRGKLVSMQARVLKVDEIPLDNLYPNYRAGDGPIDTLWKTYVTTDGAIPLTIIWTSKPKVDLELSDQVQLEAIFYRVWGYNTEGGGKAQAPALIGVGKIVKLEEPNASGIGRSLTTGILIFAVLVLVVMILLLRRDRQRSELFRRKRVARRQIQRGSDDLNDVAESLRGGADE